MYKSLSSDASLECSFSCSSGMLWSIIPLFLATNISNETAWQEGPEYIFKSKVVCQYHARTNGTYHHFVDFTNLVSCRPKSQDTLSCQYETKPILLDGSYLMDTYDGTRRKKEVREVAEKYPENPTNVVKFDIKFSRSGIVSYVSSNTLEDRELTKVKTMMNELNVGVDFTTTNERSFKGLEESLMGQCMTEFTATNTTHVKPENETRTEKLELVSVLNKNVPEDISIRRCRDLTDCSFFRASIMAEIVLKDVDSKTINVQHFCSEMNITDYFKTNSHVEGTFLLNNKSSYSFVEDYSLTLLDIRPAAAKPVHYDDTQVTSIYAMSENNKKSDNEDDKNIETVINYTTETTFEEKTSNGEDTIVTNELTTEENKNVDFNEVTSGENTTESSTIFGTEKPTTVVNFLTDLPSMSVVSVTQNVTNAPTSTVAPVVNKVINIPTSTAVPVVKHMKKTKHVKINSRAEMDNEIVTEIIDCKSEDDIKF